MIGMMEHSSSMLAYEQPARGQATVGFEVCVKHVAAAPEGATCRSRATLREVVEGRKLRFDVEVTEGERTIGVGTHERRVSSARLGPPTGDEPRVSMSRAAEQRPHPRGRAPRRLPERAGDDRRRRRRCG